MHFIPSDIIKIADSNMAEAIDPLNAAKTRLIFEYYKKVSHHYHSIEKIFSSFSNIKFE